jgi:DNA-binding NtrC family response regulator
MVPQMGERAVITETTITDDDASTGGPQGFHLLVMSLEVFSSHPLPSTGVVSVGRSTRCAIQIDDSMASREHARIHVGSEGGVPVLTIEDVGSANGTRVRDAVIKPGEPAAILPGEAIMIGSTVMMVLQNRPTTGLRRLWSHAYFETRLEDECARAAKSRASFALARIRFAGAAPWTKVMPVLARDLVAPHVFASYGPKDYETLLVDMKPEETEGVIRGLIEGFRAAGLDAQWAMSWYPRDGRTGDALLATANENLRLPGAARRPSPGDVPAPDANGMARVRDMAARAASANINVLILGEMGVGKDVLARTIHKLSRRANAPFLAINCASLAESLIEAELFGHEKGGFTGAAGDKVGLLESANGGTVFLDEIGEMPVAMQAKLLQVIETREVRPVRGVKSRPIDVRFISATNVDIEAAVKTKAFRGDLMFRLNTLTLSIPPLRERKDEIPELVETFLKQSCEEMGRTLTVSAEAVECLHGYSWPGNIRELRNVIERAVVLCDGPEIRPDHLPLEKMRPVATELTTLERVGDAAKDGRGAANNGFVGTPAEMADRQKVLDALDACAWSQTRAARRLGISRRTLVSKLERYKIPRPQKRQDDDDDYEPTSESPKNGGPMETPHE